MSKLNKPKRKTQNELAIALLSKKTTVTSKDLAAKGIACPSAVICNLRNLGYAISTLKPSTTGGWRYMIKSK